MADPKKGPTPKFEDIEIVRQGKQIIMPEGMTHEKAIQWHKRKMEEENREYAISETIDAYPLDGALAFMRALKTEFGWTDVLPPGFFENPPAMIGVTVDEFGKTEQVIWGKVAVPGMDPGYFQTGMTVLDNRVVFQLTGATLFKHKHIVERIAALTRKNVAEGSIYRNKAIRMNFPDINSKHFNPITHAPKFMDLSGAKREELIFPTRIERLLETTLFAPLMYPDACRRAGIPLKRGVLLEGPFGTGKTLTQYVAGKLALAAGWTVIYLEDITRLPEAMQFAKMYQPAFIIGEDIDRVDRGEDGAYDDRSDAMNAILNTIDGVEVKSAEIIVALTTNRVETITKALLRPGRLDAVVPVRAPDGPAVEKLIRLYGRGRVGLSENLHTVGTLLDGCIPAVIREVVERAKLASVFRTGDAVFDLVASDLEAAAEGMVEHLRLLEEQVPDERSVHEKAAAILAEALGKRPVRAEDEFGVVAHAATVQPA